MSKNKKVIGALATGLVAASILTGCGKQNKDINDRQNGLVMSLAGDAATFCEISNSSIVSIERIYFDTDNSRNLNLIAFRLIEKPNNALGYYNENKWNVIDTFYSVNSTDFNAFKKLSVNGGYNDNDKALSKYENLVNEKYDPIYVQKTEGYYNAPIVPNFVEATNDNSHSNGSSNNGNHSSGNNDTFETASPSQITDQFINGINSNNRPTTNNPGSSSNSNSDDDVFIGGIPEK